MTAVCAVDGELFVAIWQRPLHAVEDADDPERVQSHIWDASNFASLDAITTKY